MKYLFAIIGLLFTLSVTTFGQELIPKVTPGQQATDGTSITQPLFLPISGPDGIVFSAINSNNLIGLYLYNNANANIIPLVTEGQSKPFESQFINFGLVLPTGYNGNVVTFVDIPSASATNDVVGHYRIDIATGMISKIIELGDLVQDTLGGNFTIEHFFLGGSLNSRGHYTFSADLIDTKKHAISSVAMALRGLKLSVQTQSEVFIVGQGIMPVPGINNTILRILRTEINDHDDIAFEAFLDSKAIAIFLKHKKADPHVLVSEGDIVLGHKLAFLVFSGLAVDGSVSLTAKLDTDTLDAGILIISPAKVPTQVVVRTQAAPNGTTFTSINSLSNITGNKHKQIAFIATTSDNKIGLYLWADGIIKTLSTDLKTPRLTDPRFGNSLSKGEVTVLDTNIYTVATH